MASDGYKLSENSSLALDVVRALASQAVLVGHGISYFAIWPFLQPPAIPYIQNLAVLVFFILSGFLIAYATLRKPPGYRFREFFIDRFARIFTAYLPALALVWVIDRIAIHLGPITYQHGNAFDVRTMIANVFMLQDHPFGGVHSLFQTTVTSFGSARPFWTLAIEWWIYMCFGWIVLRDRARSVIAWGIVLVPLLYVPAVNVVGGRGNGLALVWIFGVAVYLLLAGRKIEASRNVFALGALAFLGLSVILLRGTKEAYDPKLAALLAAAMLCAVLAFDRITWKVPALVARAIRFVAGYSFTLYLLHYSILDLMAAHRLVADPTANFLLAFVIANVVSILVALATEAHHKRFADWLRKA
jgi:peptidoglycan/LPS O-acetylase OafA/YrhL